MRQSSNETVEVEVYVHANPPRSKAVLLSTTGDEGDAEWTPRSQIESDVPDRDKTGIVVMKEWIAKTNGFI